MERRVYVIPAGQPIDEKVLAAAKKKNCPEICQGIAPAMMGIHDEDLPCVYIEDVIAMEPRKSLDERIDDIEQVLGISPGDS